MTPPGPFRPTFWRSPLRGPRLTTLLGSVLLVLIAIVATTGFVSHAAYQPDLPGNAIVDPARDLPLNFVWPTGFTYLYALTQGLHVNVGLVAISLAWVVGVYAAALKPDAVIAGFPATLFITLAGVTLLFSIASANG